MYIYVYLLYIMQRFKVSFYTKMNEMNDFQSDNTFSNWIEIIALQVSNSKLISLEIALPPLQVSVTDQIQVFSTNLLSRAKIMESTFCCVYNTWTKIKITRNNLFKGIYMHKLYI